MLNNDIRHILKNAGVKINEEILHMEKSNYEDYYSVILKNPTIRELKENNLRKSRFINFANDVWLFFDSMQWIHEEVLDDYAKQYGKAQNSGFYNYDKNQFVFIHFIDKEDNKEEVFKRFEIEDKQWLLSHPYIQNTFGNNFNVKAIDEYYDSPWDIDGRLNESLKSENGFEIKDDADGMFHKLTLLKDGYTKASCNYTNWGDWISIDWIESFGKGKGYASQLLQYIKKQNPDVKEIGGEFVSKRIANVMKKNFGEPIEGNYPQANDYDDYLDDNDKSSCMTFKLNESVYFNDEVFNDWNDSYEHLKVLLNPSIEWLRNELNKPDCWGFRFLHNTQDNLLYVWDCHQSFMHQQVFDIIDPKWGKSGTNVIGIFEPEGVSIWEEMADDGEAESSIRLAKKLDGKLFKELYPNGYQIGLCN